MPAPGDPATLSAPCADSVAWRGIAAPHPALRAVVIVPARDEARLLPQALRALQAQTGVAPGVLEVLVLANNCADDTAQVARATAARSAACAVHVVEATLAPPLAHVGAARRALFDEACRRLAAVSATDGMLLSTDADTRVDVGWVAANLAEMRRGADAVGGRILTSRDADATLVDHNPTSPRASHGPHTDPSVDVAGARLQRLDTAYQLLRSRLESLIDPDPADPWPRHHQHFGASLAVSAAAYRRVGGQPLVPYLEDDALVRQLRRYDLRVRHSPQVRVWTSDRRIGRAEVGLAWQLRAWAQHERARSCPQVIDPAVERALWMLRAQARTFWPGALRSRHRSADDALADWSSRAGVGLTWTRQALARAPSFGIFWADAEAELARRRPDGAPPAEGSSRPYGVAMDAAVEHLRRWVRQHVAIADRGADAPAGPPAPTASPLLIRRLPARGPVPG